MDFLKALHTEKFRGIDRGSVRKFEPISINDEIWISIQASYGYRCKPDKILDDLTEYTHWEIALFDKDDNFVRAKYVLPYFASSAELEMHYDGSVYNYVPADLVNELYKELQELND